MAPPRKLLHGFHYINKYNTKIVLDFLQRYHYKEAGGNIVEYHSEEWNDDIDIIRYTVVGARAHRDMVSAVFGAIQMLLHLQASGNLSKGDTSNA